MSAAGSTEPRQGAEERLRSTVAGNVRLALRTLFGIVVLLTPVVFLLAPENVAYNAGPRAAMLILLWLSLRAHDRDRSSEGAAFIFLAIAGATVMSLIEAALTQVPNHPSQLSPMLFFLGAMMFAPLRPQFYLLLGIVVVGAPWPFWANGQLDADPVFRIMYTASGVVLGIVGAISSWQRRTMLLARFQAESALTERSEHLREATQQLEIARDAAQASDAAKSRFLSQVSHETRTPLSGILGFAELLEGRYFGDLNERQANYVRQIRESGEHLLALINDVLDVTRLDTASVDLALEDVSPAEVALEVIHNVELGSRETGITIVNELGPDAPTLRVDRRRFRQILYNLLANAVKFTRNGGDVGVRWRVEPGRWLRIEVWDRGVGIAADELESIFDEFHQVARKRDEELGGSGLGLALTRRLAELHGGRVYAESQPGRGSSFFLMMPLVSQPQSSEAACAPPDGHSKMRDGRAIAPDASVLVVDDNPANVAVIQGLLEVRGIDPIIARSGLEAVALVSRERPQLVFMDIHMPGCDGFEALAQIRAQESLTAIPVVAMTASASTSDQIRYLDAGFAAFLSKPIDSGELDRHLERFVPPAMQN